MTSININRLDGLSSATAWKGPVRVATTTNIQLSDLQIVDGVTLNDGDRVLVKDQTDARYNGIWVADTGLWRRARDFASNRDVREGTQVFVVDGATYNRSGWYVSSNDPVQFGTTDIHFTQNMLINTGQLEALVQQAQEAAEEADAARIAAEEAAAAAEAAASGLLVNFDTVAAVQSTIIPPLVKYLRTAGYYAPGSGGALYVRVLSEPAHSGKIQSSDGAWWEIASWQLNVKMFGALGDGVANDTAAFAGIRDFFQTNSAYRGGVIRIPKGYYKINANWAFTMYAPELVHNIYVKGDGQQATVLDFSGAPLASDAITFGKGVHFGIEDLSIANAKRDGLVVAGGVLGSDDFTQQGCVRNIRVSLPGRHGVTLQNAFMIEMSNVWSIGAQQYGFNIAGFCTSLDVNRCWALQCLEAGWSINGVVYSSFDACGSDQNLYGYYVRNVRGVAFVGCGAESNLRDAWLLRTSDAESAGVMVAAQNIYGLALTGCYGFHNGTQAAGQFANLVAAVTVNSRPIEVVISGCNTEKATTNDPSMSVNGASGQIKIAEQACKFDGTVFTTGNVLYEGRRFSFTPTIAGTTVAGAGTYTTRDGSYIINNGVLSYFIDAQWTGHTGTGGVSITGLPLAATKTTIGSLQTTSLAFSGSLSGQIGSGTSTLFCTYSSTGAAPTYATMAAAGRVIASGNYPVV